MVMRERFSIDRGVVVASCVGMSIGIVQYMVLLLVLDDGARFWKTLVVTIAAVSTTQVWIDATSAEFADSSATARVVTPSLSMVLLALVVALSAVSPQRGDYENSAYFWALATCAIAAVNRQVLARPGSK
jgi:hypothetical protein